MNKQPALLLCVLSLSLQAGQAGPVAKEIVEPALPVEVSLIAAWDSLYVSEGRDNLDGDGLFGTTLELGYGGLTFGTWYADSPGSPYSELNLWLEYRAKLGAWEMYASYTHLRFPGDGEEDNEAGAGIACNGLPWGIVPAFDWYHSFAAKGSFMEASLTKPIEITPKLSAEPGVIAGFNDGFMAEGHNGGNHVAVTLPVSLSLADHIALTAYASYNWAISEDPAVFADDELLKDFFYGGAALTLSF